jgi:hypothetical protein
MAQLPGLNTLQESQAWEASRCNALFAVTKGSERNPELRSGHETKKNATAGKVPAVALLKTVG